MKSILKILTRVLCQQGMVFLIKDSMWPLKINYTHMKKLFIYGVLALSLMMVSSCEEDLAELNVNEIDPSDMDPVFQLNHAILETSFPNGVLVYDIGVVQQIISPNSGVLAGANYNQDNRNATDDIWQEYFRKVIRNTRDAIRRIETNEPERANLRHMTRIIQAYAFMVLTDEYGEIPFLEAGLGFPDQVLLPAYNTQETIYPALITEFEEAAAALDEGGIIETTDILYEGNVALWKKLGYSLLLRAGMRLSKVDPATAAQVVQRAVQGGVMASNDDNMIIRHDANFNNDHGRTLNASEANNYYLAEPFVDFLKNNDDPRLEAIAVTYVGAVSGPGQVPGPGGNGSTDPDIQVGMPMGHDNNSIVGVAANLGLSSFYEFAQADRTRVVNQEAPMFMVTAAQTLLLLAEAAQRGWITGSAEDFYNAGVRAHMEQMAFYNQASAIETSAIDAYLSANPFSANAALEQINDQYWVASFLNGPEAFANFRRSGFPDLAPNPFPSQDISGDFIRRLTYPNTEISVNTENVNTAIARQGPDNLETRVWWDQ